MNSRAKLLCIFVDETDCWEQMPLYEALVRRMMQFGLSGATVHAGIMGFGRRQLVHQKRLFGMKDDRPITVMVVEEEEKIRRILPELREMIADGMIVLLDAEVI